MRIVLLATVPLLLASGAAAQNAATKGIQGVYNIAKNYVLRSAEQVPEDKYSYKPVPTVRSFGAILAHLADSNNAFCATAGGKPTAEGSSIEQTTTKRADIIAKLKESYVACDAVYNATTDAGLVKTYPMFGQQMSVSQILTLNAAHNYEHYGNLVTYMRSLGMVPPSSQGGN
jgi:uncharacterized damage-inducible protein DinB